MNRKKAIRTKVFWALFAFVFAWLSLWDSINREKNDLLPDWLIAGAAVLWIALFVLYLLDLIAFLGESDDTR